MVWMSEELWNYVRTVWASKWKRISDIISRKKLKPTYLDLSTVNLITSDVDLQIAKVYISVFRWWRTERNTWKS